MKQKMRDSAVLTAAFALLLLGAVGAYVETARASQEPRPDGVGFGVAWSHDLHARSTKMACTDCHHGPKKSGDDMIPGSDASEGLTLGGNLQACDASGCHSSGQGGTQTTHRVAQHQVCVGCHKALDQQPMTCAGCHSQNHGNAECISCHSDTGAEIALGRHKIVGCASCHPSHDGNRATDGGHAGPMLKMGNRATCLGCHGQPVDGAGFPAAPFTKQGAHGELTEEVLQNCAECHVPHAPSAG